MLELASRHLEVSIDVGRGASIVHVGRPGGSNVLSHYGWATPLPPDRSGSYGSDRLDWLAAYRGGWQEMFPNAGAACEVDGVPLPFHGEVSTAAWDVVAVGEAIAVLRCAARLPLILERTVELSTEAPTMYVRERVENESGVEVSYLWGHHPAFESPPGTRIDLPAGTRFVIDGLAGVEGVWPFLLSATTKERIDLSFVPGPPLARVIYLSPREPWYAVRPPEGPGVAAAWDMDTFSRVWLWQELGSESFPFYGRARITALEPVSSGTGEGLASARARGDVLTVPPRGEHHAWLTMSLFSQTDHPVCGVESDGSVHLL